ncbi:Succinate dehydrogenase assembly factor 2 mitochondrial [Dipsacomyces acuminosporus]|nr:Succinate dehydrogenase assembly factor 2 mitochondrial [Dipsacomyces acuminosporus]
MRYQAIRSITNLARISSSQLQPAAAMRLPALRHFTSSQQHTEQQQQQQGEDVIKKIGLERKIRKEEDLETMRRRLQYQMRKRGILETDLLLSTFACEYLNSLSREEMVELDTLLSNIDWDIFYWATEKTPAPEDVEKMAVFQKLKTHAAKRGSKITRMPALEEAK